MIRSSGLNGASSFSPSERIAVRISSCSDTPSERCCFRRKYRPASSIVCSGTSPTSSDPVTRMPRAPAARTTSSKATCSGVTLRSTRFIDTCARSYSAMYHPIAFTALSVPGIITGRPSASVMALPVTGSPSRAGRPASRTSNAMAFARRVDVVLRLTL